MFLHPPFLFLHPVDMSTTKGTVVHPQQFLCCRVASLAPLENYTNSLLSV